RLGALAPARGGRLARSRLGAVRLRAGGLRCTRHRPATGHLRRRAALGQRRHALAVELLLPVAALPRAAAAPAGAPCDLLRDEAGAALGTGLGHRLVPGHELAVGVAVAAVEGLPAPRAALHHLPGAAADAGDARRHRLVDGLHVPALGIPRAAEELAV